MNTLELPPGFKSENAPAHVIYNQDETAAYVWHPFGLDHDNAQQAIARLQRRGVLVLNAPPRRREAA